MYIYIWQCLFCKVHYGPRGEKSRDTNPRKRDPGQTKSGRLLLVYFLSSWFRVGNENMI